MLSRRTKSFKRGWKHTLTAALAVVVTFVVAYALVLPAITLDKDVASDEPGVELAQPRAADTDAGTVGAETPDSASESESVEDESASVSDPDVESVIDSDSRKDDTASTYSTPLRGVLGATIEKNVLTNDGHDYYVSVTYGDDAGVPDDAKLEVKEILQSDGAVDGATEYETYLEKTRDALGMESGVFSYVRFFDIAIVDGNGEKVEIAAPVDVSIELADKEGGEKAEENTQVVHFADDAESGDVIDNLEVDGEEIRFQTESFSAYAIVEGPGTVPLGWHKISSLDELLQMGSDGFFIGHPDGYYYGNTLVDDGSRVGIKKTKPAQSYPADAAAKYYFEPVEGVSNKIYAYCYADDGTTKQYVYNNGNNSLSFAPSENEKTAFTVTQNSNGTFKFNNGSYYWNMQGGANGARFCSYNSANDANNNVNLWYFTEVAGDPYELDGKSYGLMNWSGGVAGKALMANSSQANVLDAKSLTVMSTADNKNTLFAPNESDISMWSFHWVEEDKYYLTAVVDGSTKYLRVDEGGLTLVSTPDDNCMIQVVPGTGIHAGQIHLKSGNTTLTYSGSVDTGFSVGGSVGNEWLYLVELSELTEDYFMTYSAQKVSVSDPNITNGSRVIVYTRSWNEEKKQYEYFAIGSDGTLVPVFESGDSIEWVSGQLNKLLWNFVEYYWEDTTDPNFYYELYNQYSEKFIAPQVTDGQILSDDTIGINLNGRRDGKYCSTIIAWDDPNYSYVGLKVENGQIVSCPKSEAMDFYFAIMQDLQVDDEMTTVPTVEHTQYGITMKMVDLENKNTPDGYMNRFLGNSEGGVGTTLHQGLLSTELSNDGYPLAAGGSLGELYSAATEVNHLFIQSTYDETGYFEYSSTENFATLKKTNDGNFTVYKELGSYDSGGNKPTLKHGQFFPYNDLVPGVFASTNGKNLYQLSGSGNNVDEIPDGDPRKYENLYSIEHGSEKADCYFAMELEASFTQTPSGLDAWGHDIIFEFTGDDDFWLYVDGELVIDLGGIHSAVPGSVNFRTGEVNVNGTSMTLKDLFYNNYISRGHTEEEAQAYVEERFEQNEYGNWVFSDYTNHTMRIFYMERGGSASNLQMRFNLAAIQKGHVLLNKELGGVDASEDVMAEFAYQIWYKTSEEEGAQEYLLTNARSNDPTHNEDLKDFVFYKDTVNPVTSKPSVTIGGVTYENVFILKPGETADISFPENMTTYRIVECGVNTDVYSNVTVNGTEIEGTSGAGYAENREDYGIGYSSTDNRAKVNYVNEVNPDALKTLTITKNLFAEDGTTPIHYPDDTTTFGFRLYLATENDVLDVANMHIYHVKDPQGNYCRWDATNQQFVIIGEGITEYSNLTNEQKAQASFTTSIYGSISKIPVDYTVEIRNVLAGTQFRVQERPEEIPDGYSFQKYIYNDEQHPADAETGVADVITTEIDPLVVVCNLKGWGLRVNKIWTDAKYMLERDPVYFAVYTETTNGDGVATLTMVPGSLREMAYGTTTMYWYWQVLPVIAPFENYVIREVTVEGVPEFDADGVVTNENSLTIDWIDQGGEVSLSGQQKGETTSASFTYTVQYDPGTVSEGSNVRIDTVTNDRPGIVLEKQDWDGNPLAGAVFTLADGNGDVVGTFTSDSDGLITVAYLGEGIDYTLEEISAPQGHYGLQSPMTIRFENGEVSVTYEDDSSYTLTQAAETGPAVLILRNHPYDFSAVKVDGDTGIKLAGVPFELHRQVTVDDVTSFDLNPMPGYENLVTDEDGIIPKIDNTLPVGVYQLREKQTPNGYQNLPGYVEFSVSKTGEVTLLTQGGWVSLSEVFDNENGSLEYKLTIRNYIDAQITLKKVDQDNNLLLGSKFRLWKYGDTWEVVSGYEAIDLTQVAERTLTGLSVGSYRLEEIQSPDDYVILTKDIYFTIDQNGVASLTDEPGASGNGNAYASISSNVITVMNVPGAALPNTGGSGVEWLRLIGVCLILLAAIGMILKTCRGRPVPARGPCRSGPHDCRNALFDKKAHTSIGKGRRWRPPKGGGDG